jgi:hypothetical protein
MPLLTLRAVRFVHYMECTPVLAKEVAGLKMQIKAGLRMVLQALDYAAVFLEHNVQKAPKAAK